MSLYPTPEGSFTPSEKLSNAYITHSIYTPSTTAFQSDVDSATTLNTLSMITTPWTTESCGLNSEKMDATDVSESCYSWFYDSVSSSTVPPRSSSSYVITSPSVHSKSNTTVTLLSRGRSFSPSVSMRPLTQKISKPMPETFSSWTLETFTSSGWLSDAERHVVKPKYPWSPNTTVSGTDTYPSSLRSLSSRRESRVTIATTSMTSRRKKGHITPLNYIGLANNPQNSAHDWAIGKSNGIPLGASLSTIVAM